MIGDEILLSRMCMVFCEYILVFYLLYRNSRQEGSHTINTCHRHRYKKIRIRS